MVSNEIVNKNKIGNTSILVLNNKTKIPVLGFGTWQIQNGPNAVQVILEALKSGYRHIDTAKIYGNEESVGKAIKQSGIPREKIFVTTKIWNSDHADPRAALEASLKRLGMDYVDLYLIHWPVPERLATWKVMEELYEEGKCKAIGVSNFTITHLTELLKIAKMVPAVNQIEFSPFLNQQEILDFCKSKGIVVEAYSPLTRGERLGENTIKDMAKKYDKSTAQIMIRWSIQHGLVVLPKSSNPVHIKENFDINFEIKPTDMKKLDAINEDKRYCWDPSKMK